MDGNFQRDRELADEIERAHKVASAARLSVRSMEQALIEALDMETSAGTATRTALQVAPAPAPVPAPVPAHTRPYPPVPAWLT